MSDPVLSSGEFGGLIAIRGSDAPYVIDVRSNHPVRGECVPHDKRLIVRDLGDEGGEILLHEVLHALLIEGRFRATPGPVGGPRLIVGDEEQIVSHLSHGLHDAGWRRVVEQ